MVRMSGQLGSLGNEPGMGDLTPRNRADLRRQQRDDSHRLAVERHELNLITGAVLVDKHDGANIASHEMMFRNIAS